MAPGELGGLRRPHHDPLSSPLRLSERGTVNLVKYFIIGYGLLTYAG